MMNLTQAPLSAVVIGGSAGALDALDVIVEALPVTFPLPVAVVVHLRPSRPSGLAQVLKDKCALPVKEADDKEPLTGGVVYLASPNYHLLVERERCFSLSVDEALHFSRPSIDVLFETAAEAYGPALCGILLSGANEDGAAGLARIRAEGGLTIVQAPQTAAARQMPEAALARDAGTYVLPPNEIVPLLSALMEQEAITGVEEARR